MPVPDHVRQCVGFIGVKKDGQFRPRATIFVVKIEEYAGFWYYIVTAEHNVHKLMETGNKAWLRINNKSGGADELEISVDQWHFHPDHANTRMDVAVAPIAFDSDVELNPIPIVGSNSVAATQEVIDKVRIGSGDQIVMTGLFRSHWGEQRNVPIIRIGNLAMLKGERVHTKDYGYIEAHLVEVRSIGGLSGSPVFVHFPPSFKLKHQNEPAKLQFYLLGLMHGHFDIENLNADVVSEDLNGVTTGIHTGIGVVIPVERIIETIMQPKLKEKRRAVADGKADLD